MLIPAAHMATPITNFVAFEAGNFIDGLCRLGLITHVWCGAFIAVVGVKMVVDVALKVVGTMEPWASADEDTARKPFRTVITDRKEHSHKARCRSSRTGNPGRPQR
jgi:hypothetical protein